MAVHIAGKACRSAHSAKLLLIPTRNPDPPM